MNLLVLLSLVLFFVGFVMLTPATTGVGAIAMACFFAILARILQAERHHQSPKVSPAPPKPPTTVW